MKKMLLVVDPQIDFINGSLPVAGAAEAMDALAEYVKTSSDEYIVRIVTSDWHPYHHSSFVEMVVLFELIIVNVVVVIILLVVRHLRVVNMFQNKNM